MNCSSQHPPAFPGQAEDVCFSGAPRDGAIELRLKSYRSRVAVLTTAHDMRWRAYRVGEAEEEEEKVETRLWASDANGWNKTKCCAGKGCTFTRSGWNTSAVCWCEFMLCMPATSGTPGFVCGKTKFFMAHCVFQLICVLIIQLLLSVLITSNAEGKSGS